ncbi:UNVERIFIED_CONTAM: hypothetical protein Slati_0210300 [Sesamum latifolium]|uniref:Uncharacterized protein n=1 Tax=Sesamum latifolium TaxID=2727402 RepID=A0AAW2YBM9_9LAMI
MPPVSVRSECPVPTLAYNSTGERQRLLVNNKPDVLTTSLQCLLVECPMKSLSWVTVQRPE